MRIACIVLTIGSILKIFSDLSPAIIIIGQFFCSFGIILIIKSNAKIAYNWWAISKVWEIFKLFNQNHSVILSFKCKKLRHWLVIRWVSLCQVSLFWINGVRKHTSWHHQQQSYSLLFSHLFFLKINLELLQGNDENLFVSSYFVVNLVIIKCQKLFRA